MKSAAEVLFDPTISGHRLVEPILWHGRQVVKLFTTPLSKNIFYAGFEVLARIVAFISLAVLSASLIVTGPAALLGWAIKVHRQPKAEASSDSPTPPTPVAPLASSASSPSSSSTAPPIHPAAPSIPFTPEIVSAAQRKVVELSALYNDLKSLTDPKAHQLFNGIAEFRSLYDKYRNPDPIAVDAMTKVFHSMDEIITNTSGMKAAADYWNNYLRIQADPQEVVQQPQDGNCWLHTSIVGLKHIGHPKLGEDTYLTLRPQVVRWMETNYATDRTLQRYITDAVDNHIHAERGHLHAELRGLIIAPREESPYTPEEQAQARAQIQNSLEELKTFSLPDYFKHMHKVGSHGTHAELYAISRMFQVNVAIWRDVPASADHPRLLTNEYDEQIDCPHAQATINAVLTQKGNHFNYRLPPRQV